MIIPYDDIFNDNQRVTAMGPGPRVWILGLRTSNPLGSDRQSRVVERLIKAPGAILAVRTYCKATGAEACLVATSETDDPLPLIDAVYDLFTPRPAWMRSISSIVAEGQPRNWDWSGNIAEAAARSAHQTIVDPKASLGVERMPDPKPPKDILLKDGPTLPVVSRAIKAHLAGLTPRIV